MVSPYSAAFICMLLVTNSAVTNSATQSAPPRASAAADSDAAALGRGWAALAGGNRAAAVTAADGILRRQPAHHGALDLKIEAMTDQPIAALDVYELWLVKFGSEDLFLLQPIARGTLELLASGGDASLQIEALERLARAGVADAATRLGALPAASAANLDVQRALAGDARAANGLLDPARAAGVPPTMLVPALTAAGAIAAPALRGYLKHPAPPVRMLAAIALGKIGATDSIPDLQQLMADPELRNAAAIGLVRLGQPEGEPVVQEMLRSESSDVRLFGADAYDHTKPGPWVQAIMPALQDPNGLTRIRAAEALRDVAPEAALPVLREAALDPNPVVRADVSRVFEGFRGVATPASLEALRRLLRDSDPSVRLHAAGAILQLARR